MCEKTPEDLLPVDDGGTADKSIVSGLIWTKFELLLEPHSISYVCHHNLGSEMNSETYPYIQRHASHINFCYTINHTLIGKGEMPYECGASSLLNGASCLTNGASCLLVVGRLFLWGELSWVELSLGRTRVVSPPNHFPPSRFAPTSRFAPLVVSPPSRFALQYLKRNTAEN